MFTAADMVNNAQNEAAILNLFGNNIVMVQYDPSQNFGRVYPMRVDAGWGFVPYTAKKSDGTIIDVLSIKNVPSAATVANFNAFWCPYQSNDCKMAWLDNGADYMFTAKMDGCTFALGSAAPSGGRMVAHANLGGQGQDQLSLIKSQIAFNRDTGMKYMGPGSYRFADTTGGTEATTFGLRLATGEWKFYSQIVLIDKTAKTMQLVEVRAIA
jgi:hypothetical protein